MAEDTTSKTKIDDEAKKAIDLVQHLELDLKKVKEHLKNIETGSKELSHFGKKASKDANQDANQELSHTGGGGVK